MAGLRVAWSGTMAEGSSLDRRLSTGSFAASITIGVELELDTPRVDRHLIAYASPPFVTFVPSSPHHTALRALFLNIPPS